MNVLIPMAGLGQRFKEKGYTISKPLIPVTSWITKKQLPMVIAAVKDLQLKENDKIIFVTRPEHKSQGAIDVIQTTFNDCKIITITENTLGQASSCLLAKELINNNDPLLISGCDNGILFDIAKFESLKSEMDALVFTFRNDQIVLENPKGFGWVKVDENNNVIAVKVKVPISENPIKDHAIVATFWFRHGSDFVLAAEEMILNRDFVNGEFYVDQVINYLIKNQKKVKVFEVDKYLGWGTPLAYENYEKTFQYWSAFFENERERVKQ